MLIGYARVSTRDQKAHLHLDALREVLAAFAEFYVRSGILVYGDAAQSYLADNFFNYHQR